MRGKNGRGGQTLTISDKHLKWRILAALLCLAIAAAAFAYGIAKWTAGEKGWQVIAPTADAAAAAADFVLTYDLGRDGNGTRAERREIQEIYSRACQEAEEIFGAGDGTVSGVAAGDGSVYAGGLAALNGLPNRQVKLHPALYGAFSLLEQYGNRTAYLGPAARLYQGLFTCTADWQLADFDPEQNPALKDLFARIASYANDPGSVSVELLGDNLAILRLSDEYQTFLEEEGLGGALDLGWMKNAFVADYLAEALTQAGHTHGSISSYDGYIRNLDAAAQSDATAPSVTPEDDIAEPSVALVEDTVVPSVTLGDDATAPSVTDGTKDTSDTYRLNIFDWVDNRAVSISMLTYAPPMTFVCYRNFPVSEMDKNRVYVTESGERKTWYLSCEDGLPRAGAESLVAYARERTCAELLMQTAPFYQDGQTEQVDWIKRIEQTEQNGQLQPEEIQKALEIFRAVGTGMVVVKDHQLTSTT